MWCEDFYAALGMVAEIGGCMSIPKTIMRDDVLHRPVEVAVGNIALLSSGTPPAGFADGMVFRDSAKISGRKGWKRQF